MVQQVQRLVPERPFPAYSFVPGLAPHPRSDPAGHSFGAPPEPPAKLDVDRWETCTSYLYGIDLFNGRFYWESHEQFEGLWLGCGRAGVAADFLKGLIHLAAAGVKHLEGRPAGVCSHAGRAAELWRGVDQEVFLGFGLKELVRLVEEVRQHGWPQQPPVLLPSVYNVGFTCGSAEAAGRPGPPA